MVSTEKNGVETRVYSKLELQEFVKSCHLLSGDWDTDGCGNQWGVQYFEEPITKKIFAVSYLDDHFSCTMDEFKRDEYTVCQVFEHRKMVEKVEYY